MVDGNTPVSWVSIPGSLSGGGRDTYLNKPGPEALSVDVPWLHATAPADNAPIVSGPLEESARETSGCL